MRNFIGLLKSITPSTELLRTDMKKQRFDFSKKAHSTGGRISLILALVSFALFGAAAAISWIKVGEAGSFVGGFGVTGLLLALYGFIVGMRSFKEKNVSPVLSVAGSIGCGIMTIVFLTLFLVGLK